MEVNYENIKDLATKQLSSSMGGDSSTIIASASDIITDTKLKIGSFLSFINDSQVNTVRFTKQFKSYYLNSNYDGTLLKEKLADLIRKAGSNGI